MEEHGRGLGLAREMLALFESVGVKNFDLTHTNIDQEKRGFRPAQSLRQVRNSMPYLLDSAVKRLNNVIVRPHNPPAVLLVQLDDLDATALERVTPTAFMTLNTSPGNFQAWIAVGCDGIDKADFARRLRKGTGADPTASGATRVAGTANYKRKYEPGFPIVGIHSAREGRVATPAELDEMGLVAPPEPVKEVPASPLRAPASGRPRPWPSYQRCLADAPKAHNADKPDISRVDFSWCLLAIDRGHSIEDTAKKLLQESAKAKENGEHYAITTVTNAAASVDRRQRRLR